jgi:hypothetical protein
LEANLSVPSQAGIGCELNWKYHLDAVAYLKAAEQKVSMPGLFDLLAEEGVEL